MSKLIPAVGYVRMSSKKQDKSPEQQKAAIEEYAAQHGFKIVRWYVDEGISGWKGSRHGFQTMIADSSASKFEVILCWDQDRFSRFEPTEFFHYCYLLNQAGVRIETVAQGRLDLANMGWIVAGVNQQGKAQYVRDLARNISRGLVNAAKDGKSPGSKPPYGYKRAERRLTLGDAAHVETVQWIFSTFATTDTSRRNIAVQLKEQGVPSSNGVRWSEGSINKILRNVLYTGDFVWPRNTQAQFYRLGPAGEPIPVTENGGKRQKHEGFQVFYKDHHPAIVDRTTWAKVQQKLADASRGSVPRGTSAQPLAHGILFCGHCGGVMKGYKGSHYLCAKYGQGACKHYSVRESDLLPFIVNKLLEEVTEAELLLREPEPPTSTASSKAVAQLQKKLDELDLKIRRTQETAIDAPKTQKAAFFDRLEELNAERSELVEKLQAARKANESPASVKAALNEYVAWWRDIKDRLIRIRPGVEVAPYAPFLLPGEAFDVPGWGREPIHLETASLRQLLLDLNCKVTLLWEPVESPQGRQKFRLASGQFRIGGQSGELSLCAPQARAGFGC
jgi:site-specific DNA recombinase